MLNPQTSRNLGVTPRSIAVTAALILAAAAGIIGAKTTTWTNAGVGVDWGTAGNWSNGVAVSGDTIVLAGADGPGTGQPGAGTVLHVRISSGSYDYDEGLDTIYAGGATIASLSVAGSVDMADASATIASVVLSGGTLTLNGSGTLTAAVTADDDSTLDWDSGAAIVGTLDAGGNEITHAHLANATLRYAASGTYDPGTDNALEEATIVFDAGITVTIRDGAVLRANDTTLTADQVWIAGTGTLRDVRPSGHVYAHETVVNGGGNSANVHFDSGATATGTGTGT